MAKFNIEFKHVEETTYTGWVEAESEHEARMMAEENPFDIEGLEEYDVQGIEVKDIYVEEE